MPNYDYVCSKCKTVFNVFHKMSETPNVKCPKCKAKASKQLSENSNIIFKGSGFYVNDYKKKGSDKKIESSKTCTKHKCDDGCSCGS
ncbi:TPA: FmdB family transcriptional regulator [candidate division WOR-3 bacterium]|uniref:FmdB family transcriptional regulator n=1 Tax=candidate division WOR-3 bacterium TaxID=2052148 RepID=A0A350H9J7_UNCW3|nr:FmdB family transcriptional regulator [candidate division WOR-3 bacterium]